MTRRTLAWAWIALLLLTLAALVGAYQVLFDSWMTAYPFANAGEWRTRFYIRLVTALVISLLWAGLVIWLWLQRKRRNRP